jgi:hypothetical protein
VSSRAYGSNAHRFNQVFSFGAHVALKRSDHFIANAFICFEHIKWKELTADQHERVVDIFRITRVFFVATEEQRFRVPRRTKRSSDNAGRRNA